MLATRTYQITGEDLDRLRCALELFNTQNANCAGDSAADLCEDCQKGANLHQLLVDALSMREAGMAIILTTQMESVESRYENVRLM